MCEFCSLRRLYLILGIPEPAFDRNLIDSIGRLYDILLSKDSRSGRPRSLSWCDIEGDNYAND